MSQYATFRLGDRLFGLDLVCIREINRILDITPVPHAPLHIRGLINLRGQIVTILDLGVRLGLPAREISDESRNIILKTDGELGSCTPENRSGRCGTSVDPVGFLVDAIGDVVEADAASIEPLSANVHEAESQFLSGIIKTKDSLLVILDLKEILSPG